MKLSNKDHLDLFLQHGIDLRARKIRLHGEIDENMSRNCLTGLDLMRESDEGITIEINSEGGSVPDGLAIFDAIAGHENEITVIVTGWACSMAFIIVQAADVRVTTKWASFMTHQMTASSEGNPGTVINWGKWGRDLENRFNKLLGERTNKPAGWWKNKQNSDEVMSAQRALELGVVDRIM